MKLFLMTLLGVLLMQQPTFAFLTHAPEGPDWEACYLARKEEILKRGASASEQLKTLDELAAFPLGRFLVQNRGLNGFWTDYILMHPKRTDTPLLSPLERYVLNESPTTQATQERFDIFQGVIQKEVREGAVLASVPCGLMSDLLTLDFSNVKTITLIGSDIDEESITLAKENAKRLGRNENVHFVRCDAWNLKLPERVDVLTSNGLNIYEPNDERVVELYRNFFAQLKPGGVLVTSFLTPPPMLNPSSEWKMDQVDLAAAAKQKLLFVDVIDSAWQAYRTSAKTRAQLQEAGFVDIEILPGKAMIFPTVVARRPKNLSSK